MDRKRQDPGPEGRLWDVRTAAAFLGISESLIRKLSARRKLPVVRIGRLTRYNRSDLVRWAQRRSVYPKDWAS